MSKKTEDPGTSQRKQRGPQKRDIIAALAESRGMGLGSGRSWERCTYVAKKVKSMKEEGLEKEADVLLSAIDISKRGAYEVARLSDEALLALCRMVTESDAPNLIVAYRAAKEYAQSEVGSNKPVTLFRAKDDMYRIASKHNKSSVLATAQDLIELHALLEYLMPELKEKSVTHSRATEAHEKALV